MSHTTNIVDEAVDSEPSSSDEQDGRDIQTHERPQHEIPRYRVDELSDEPSDDEETTVNQEPTFRSLLDQRMLQELRNEDQWFKLVVGVTFVLSSVYMIYQTVG